MSLPDSSRYQIDAVVLGSGESVLIRCDLARKLEDAGDYLAACEALDDLWPNFDERPRIEELDQPTAAEVLLRVGVLVGWLGSARQIAGAQERAKNLISESARVFEGLKDTLKVAEAQTDLAYCYWREGEFEEARLLLRDVLLRLTDLDTYQKGVALVRSAIIEKEATRYNDALRLLIEAAPLIEAINNDSLKGKFHNEFGTVLKDLGVAEKREDYIDRALVEFAAASFHFEQAGHNRYRACVENNLGFLYSMVGRFPEAYEHLNRARQLFIQLKDHVHAAQTDDTRARVMLIEGRNDDAEKTARASVNTLSKGGHQHLLAEALTTRGTALARLGDDQQARHTLQRAIEVAEHAGDMEAAGHATLTMLEELGDLFPASKLSEMFLEVSRVLATSQHPTTRARLSECANQVLQALQRQNNQSIEADRDDAFKPPPTGHNFHLREENKRYEAYLIGRALKEYGGSVTRAAQGLGLKHHQSLNALLNGRHQNLIHLRTPITPRKKSLFSSSFSLKNSNSSQRVRRKRKPTLQENVVEEQRNILGLSR